MPHHKRPRLLYPSLWDSEKVACLSNEAFRLYIWMLTQADDDGRSDWFPGRIASGPWLANPIPVADAVNIIKEVGAAGLAVLYEFGGKRYYQVNKWHDFQHFKTGRYEESTYPAPDTSGSSLDPEWIHGGSMVDPDRIPQGQGQGQGQGQRQVRRKIAPVGARAACIPVESTMNPEPPKANGAFKAWVESFRGGDADFAVAEALIAKACGGVDAYYAGRARSPRGAVPCSPSGCSDTTPRASWPPARSTSTCTPPRRTSAT
jgi:hypothetical protein